MIKEYTFHEVANLFPMMDEEAFEALKADIIANGLIEPIWTFEGKIIDGRNRYKACLAVDVPPVFREWDGQGSLVSFVVSLNLNRRHLTSSQRSTVAVDMLPLLEEEARQRQIEAGKAQGGDRKSEGYQQNRHVQIVEQADQPPPKREKPSIELAAEITGTNKQYVADMKTIKEKAPEKVQDIRDGKVSVPAVMKELRQEGVIPPKTTNTGHTVIPKNQPLDHSHSTAWQFSAIAISQLKRIERKDPKRREEFQRVIDFCNEQLFEGA